jgi:hypothetical protein
MCTPVHLVHTELPVVCPRRGLVGFVPWGMGTLEVSMIPRIQRKQSRQACVADLLTDAVLRVLAKRQVDALVAHDKNERGTEFGLGMNPVAFKTGIQTHGQL